MSCVPTYEDCYIDNVCDVIFGITGANEAFCVFEFVLSFQLTAWSSCEYVLLLLVGGRCLSLMIMLCSLMSQQNKHSSPNV